MLVLQPWDDGGGSLTRARYTAMHADLRNLGHAQERYRAEFGRVAGSLEELGDTLFQASSYVSVTMRATSDTSFVAEATHEMLGGTTCRMQAGVASGGMRDAQWPEPTCEPRMPRRSRFRF